MSDSTSQAPQAPTDPVSTAPPPPEPAVSTTSNDEQSPSPSQTSPTTPPSTTPEPTSSAHTTSPREPTQVQTSPTLVETSPSQHPPETDADVPLNTLTSVASTFVPDTRATAIAAPAVTASRHALGAITVVVIVFAVVVAAVLLFGGVACLIKRRRSKQRKGFSTPNPAPSRALPMTFKRDPPQQQQSPPPAAGSPNPFSGPQPLVSSSAVVTPNGCSPTFAPPDFLSAPNSSPQMRQHHHRRPPPYLPNFGSSLQCPESSVFLPPPPSSSTRPSLFGSGLLQQPYVPVDTGGSVVRPVAGERNSAYCSEYDSAATADATTRAEERSSRYLGPKKTRAGDALFYETNEESGKLPSDDDVPRSYHRPVVGGRGGVGLSITNGYSSDVTSEDGGGSSLYRRPKSSQSPAVDEETAVPSIAGPSQNLAKHPPERESFSSSRDENEQDEEATSRVATSSTRGVGGGHPFFSRRPHRSLKKTEANRDDVLSCELSDGSAFDSSSDEREGGHCGGRGFYGGGRGGGGF